MLHHHVGSAEPDPAFAYKKRLGARLFLVYAAVYAGFVLVNLISPRAMALVLFAGLDLAVVYGFGLILFALALALLYSALCSRRETALSQQEKER
ncbi:MAG: DUF485 domain-containing protein [Spirochaetales bacterium]|nr:DUF485 domain-containing protein [Spirochaetales bacterium]